MHSFILAIETTIIYIPNCYLGYIIIICDAMTILSFSPFPITRNYVIPLGVLVLIGLYNTLLLTSSVKCSWYFTYKINIYLLSFDLAAPNLYLSIYFKIISECSKLIG